MSRFRFHFVGFIAVACSFNACISARKSLAPEEYKEWYSSEKFIWKTSDTINNLIYAFRYFPNEVSLASSALDNSKTKIELKEAIKNRAETFTFLFEIQSQNWNQNVFDFARPELTKTEIITYLNGQIKSDLKAISVEKDTLECTAILYEPITTNKIRLLISFEGHQAMREIILFDRVFSGYKQQFSIPELALNTTPTLKF